MPLLTAPSIDATGDIIAATVTAPSASIDAAIHSVAATSSAAGHQPTHEGVGDENSPINNNRPNPHSHLNPNNWAKEKGMEKIEKTHEGKDKNKGLGSGNGSIDNIDNDAKRMLREEMMML